MTLYKEVFIIRATAPIKPILHNRPLITLREAAYITIALTSFFLGRVMVFQVINPLAIPFLSFFLFQGFRFYLVLFFVTAGIFTDFSLLYSVKYLTCGGFLLLLNFYLPRRIQKPSALFKAGISSACIFTSGLLWAYVNNMSMYFLFLAVLETILCFCMSFILRKGIFTISNASKRKTNNFNTDEMISFSIILVGIIAGSAGIFIGDFSLRYFFCTLTILVAAYNGGAAFSCMTGVLIGFSLYSLGWEDSSIIGILAISGICSGMLKGFGKLASAAGFVVSGTLAVLYINSSLISKEMFISVLIANIVNLILPERFSFNMSAFLFSDVSVPIEHDIKLREVATLRLYGFSDSFKKLAKTFDSLADKKNDLSQQDVTTLVDDITGIVCVPCKFYESCWQQELYNTNQAVFRMLGACEKRGFIKSEDILNDFQKNCIKLKDFTDTTARVFDKYKYDLVWRNRIADSRALISDQLYGVSEILHDLSEELTSGMIFKEELESDILSELNKQGMGVENVIVLENKQGRYEVTFNKKACFGKKTCHKESIPIISKILSRKMARDERDCVIKNDYCRIRLIEDQRFRVTSGVAKATKSGSELSGDSYSSMELKNGQCYLMLSDGMGSGSRARDESSAAIDLLEEFIESGFSKETAVKIINSILVLKSDDDTFSTLDICAIDLYTGASEFVKIGASATYLMRDNEISVISSSSLPVGILNKVEPEITRKKLKNSDMIIMVTDGISDINGTIDGSWIAEKLKELRSNNPQDVSDFLLREAQLVSKGTLKDDMTVLAARIWEKV